MTLYEELYFNTPDLSKFYRFEGIHSFPHFCFQKDEYLTDMSRYIYFSKSAIHHTYYVTRKLKRLISLEILKDTDYFFNKKTLLDNTIFKEIEKKIENYLIEDDLLSIEFSFLSIMNEMLEKNSISNRRKEADNRKIEKVDHNIYGGGYGFCD